MVLARRSVQRGRPRHLRLPSGNMGRAATRKDTASLPEHMSRHRYLSDSARICDSTRSQTAAMLQRHHAE